MAGACLTEKKKSTDGVEFLAKPARAGDES